MSVDAHMQARMSDISAAIPAFRVGEALEGSAVGIVVASEAVGFFPGDVVTSMLGWREYHIAHPGSVRRVDDRIQPMSAHLSVLGTTGLAAWGAIQLAQARPGESVLVSAAAGAVGNVIGQLAKLQGCYVGGAVSSAESVDMLVLELGFDAAFDVSQAELGPELDSAFPDGIDLYFDTVGGADLDDVLLRMRPKGRIITCGALSPLDEPAPLRRPSNRALFASKRLTMTGFLVSDWLGLAPVFHKAFGDLLLSGRLRAIATIIDGIERAPYAFQQLSSADKLAKVIVNLL